jgi:uncharacterized protein YjbJ (UPF0337 family)
MISHEIKGKARNQKGRMKQAAGAVIGNKKMENQGIVERTSGAVEEAVGKARRKVGDAVSAVSDAIKK